MTTKLRRARSVLATALVLVAGVILAMRTADAAARTTVVAYFDNSNGVFAGDDVLIRGVPVGKIVKIEPQPLRAKISFWFDRKYRVPADAAAAILSPQLVTGRAIQLTPPYAGGPTMADGTVIPQERTVVPVEWDDLRAQLQRLTALLQPTRPGGVSTLGALINTAADNLRGQGATIRDTIIKLSQAISALGDHSKDIFSTVTNLSTLVTALHDSADLLERLNHNLAAVTSLLADGPDKIGQAAEDLNAVVADVLPASAPVGTTSLLGSYHIELAPPKGEARQGKLRDGSLIALSHGSAYPSTEQTLAALSLVLNGGGLGQVQDITEALSTAFAGREHDLRGLIGQLDTFTAYLNNQSGDIIAATDSLNRLVGKFADQQPVFDRALATIPDALAVLADERDTLVEAAEQLSKFSALTVDSVNKTTANLVTELRQLGPVLESLANSGPALTRSLSLLATFPFPNETFQNFQRGEYANLTAIVDLTLSRIDQGLLTGTRWECHLTQLELQWGRTIGQFPSPCTAGYRGTPGNPLTIAYRWDQGP